MASAIPSTSDTGCRDWCSNFDLIATATPSAVGLTAGQMTSFHGLSTDYNTKLATATEPSTRTKVTVQQKNTSKLALLALARQYVRIVDAFPGTTDAQRVSLGMRVKDAGPTPIPAPTTQPVVSVEGTGGGQALIRLNDETTPLKRAKPHGVFGALLSMAVTPADAPAPTFPPGVFNAVITKTSQTLDLPPGSAGKRLWLQAQWMNERGQPGPTSTIASAVIAA